MWEHWEGPHKPRNLVMQQIPPHLLLPVLLLLLLVVQTVSVLLLLLLVHLGMMQEEGKGAGCKTCQLTVFPEALVSSSGFPSQLDCFLLQELPMVLMSHGHSELHC